MAPPPYPITEAPAYLSQARQIYQNRPSTASSTTYASAFAVPKSTNDGSPATTNPFTDRSSAHAPSSASLNQDETYEERIQREKREKRKIERQDRLEKERVAREEKAKRDLEAPVARRDRWGRKSEAEMTRRVEARELQRKLEAVEARKKEREDAKEAARRADGRRRESS